MQALDTLEKSKDFAQLPGLVRRQPAAMPRNWPT